MSLAAATELTAARGASSVAGRGATTAAAASKAGGSIDTLAGKLAPKVGGRGELIDALTGLGYSAAQARAAADRQLGKPASKSTPAAKSTSSRSTSRPAKSTSSSSSSTPPASSGPTLTLPTVAAPAMGGNASGFILGLVATAALINFMHGGTPQLKAWLAAKFLNKPGTGGVGIGAPKHPDKPPATNNRQNYPTGTSPYAGGRQR